MAHYKQIDVPGVEALELMEVATPELRSVPVRGGIGPERPRDPSMFHPGYNIEWLIGAYWRDAAIDPNGAAPFEGSDGAENADRHLPYIWGSSSKQ